VSKCANVKPYTAGYGKKLCSLQSMRRGRPPGRSGDEVPRRGAGFPVQHAPPAPTISHDTLLGPVRENVYPLWGKLSSPVAYRGDQAQDGITGHRETTYRAGGTIRIRVVLTLLNSHHFVRCFMVGRVPSAFGGDDDRNGAGSADDCRCLTKKQRNL